MNITFDNRREILEQLPKVYLVKFAVYAARLVSHLNTNQEVKAAIQVAERWIEDPSQANIKADAAAAYAAAADANTANAAADAADATKISEEIKQQMVQYLKELYLDSLPEDERNCWLVQAAIGV